MYNKKLIDYLQSCRLLLEYSSEREKGEDFSGLSYLYFAPIKERLTFHVAENYLNHNCRNPFISLTQQCQNNILDFRPFFDAALTGKKITSICEFTIPPIENFSSDLKINFIKELKEIEQSRGILNTLLNLRNWAFFPNQNKGAKNKKRIAGLYLKIVLTGLICKFNESKKGEMLPFLNWCGKRTRKILTWGPKEKDLLSPHPSTLKIYKDESAAYLKYFLQMACDSESKLKQHFAEMCIYLSLCFACARKYSKRFSPKEILKITGNSLMKLPQVSSSKPVKDIRERSKGEHDALTLIISEDFLADNELWPPMLIDTPACDLDQYCKIVRVKGRTVPFSQRLAHAIELMGEFSLTVKDVENRIQKAFEIVGLSQSGGGISSKCFLNEYHYWEGEDLGRPKQVVI